MPRPKSRVTIRELGRGDRRGALFVVSVPIGNDDDLSPRARQVLEAADVVLAEDTRRFRDLAQRAGLHVEARVLELPRSQRSGTRGRGDRSCSSDGARVALVSDAGTPLCSDPGYVVVSRAVDEGFAVSPVPGPSSLLAVLERVGAARSTASCTSGFLPAAFGGAPGRASPALANAATRSSCTKRRTGCGGLLADLAAVCPDWELCIGREVTKVFEEFRRGTAGDLAAELADDEDARGEFTLVVAPPPGSDDAARAVDAGADEQLDRLVRALLAARCDAQDDRAGARRAARREPQGGVRARARGSRSAR